MLTRLGSTALASIAAAAVFSYLFRLQITSDLFFRSNLIPLFVLLSLWSAAVRLLLRRLRPSRPQGRWHIVALPREIASLAAEWRRSLVAAGPLPEITELSSGSSAAQLLDGEALALSAGVINDASLQRFCQEAVNRGQAVFSVVELAEQELQRIPTRWIDNQWLLFSASIDGQRTSLQKQLKRSAAAAGARLGETAGRRRRDLPPTAFRPAGATLQRAQDPHDEPQRRSRRGPMGADQRPADHAGGLLAAPHPPR
jgi:hypothetical protein